mmetsp:Transcript_8227/g.30511  ORF Transcript_8227/g.30511 Transcript_8227/m.30511 type:complete len:268 (-) Transcript_8227:1068-1871(-)
MSARRPPRRAPRARVVAARHARDASASTRRARPSTTARPRRARGVVAFATEVGLGESVANALKGISVVVVGDDERANDAVARALATQLQYSPVSVPALIASSEAVGAVEADEGDGAAGLDADAARLVIENSAHEQLSTFLRLCVATCGGGRGATARGDCWAWLFGSMTVWVDIEGADVSAPQRDAYELSEIRVVVKDYSDFDGNVVAAQVLSGIKQLVDSDDQLCGKKNLYVRFGCRGDWPDLAPPGEYAGDAAAAKAAASKNEGDK